VLSISLNIGQYNVQQTGNNFQCIKYITTGENIKKFEESVTQEIAKKKCTGPAGKKTIKL